MKINKLPTGVPGLDEILGGGLPEFSFNIIAGSPGCGKTTMAHQFVFANATPERPAHGLYRLDLLRTIHPFPLGRIENSGLCFPDLPPAPIPRFRAPKSDFAGHAAQPLHVARSGTHNGDTWRSFFPGI